MRIFISTGEVSGDLQGSLLITALKRQAMAIGLKLEIVALGGEKWWRLGQSYWAILVVSAQWVF